MARGIVISHATGIWLLCLFSSVLAQVLPKPSDQTTVRIATRLVQITVVAETGKGEPVADLKREEFSLSDGGHEESLSMFTIETSAATDTKLTALPPNTFSNRFERSGLAPASATVILFDGLNTRIQDQTYARLQIQKFLSQLKPDDRVGLYVMGRGPRVLQEITGDSSALNKALMDYHGEQSPSLNIPLYDLDMSVTTHFDAWLGELTFGLADHFARDRALRTVRLLESIANHLHRLPGRKNLIWVSGSFPAWIGSNSVFLRQQPGSTRSDLKREIERTTRALNSANLAIYPVDARGLISPQEYNPDRDVIRPQSGWPDSGTIRAMQLWAERTGGRAYYNTNDLEGALRQASDDGRASYLLGYYPSHKSWNGEFRKIKIKVTRPNVQLRYRNGYFAQPDVAEDTAYRQASLDAAMWNPIDATTLGLTVQVSGTGRRFDLQVLMDPSDVTFKVGSGIWECGIDVWLVQFGSKDAYLKTTGHTANLRFEQTAYQQVVLARALPLKVPLELLPETTLVRVLVRDLRSGALGSISIPVRRMISR
jgi:VWFA-related protein